MFIRFFLLAILLLSLSCSFISNNYLYSKNDAKLLIHNSVNKERSFTFIVSDRLSIDSSITSDEKYKNMTKNELRILKRLLRKNSYCINNSNDLLFTILSRQEKIYDVTFSGLIEQQYNAKSLTPVTYFGKCL